MEVSASVLGAVERTVSDATLSGGTGATALRFAPSRPDGPRTQRDRRAREDNADTEPEAGEAMYRASYYRRTAREDRGEKSLVEFI